MSSISESATSDPRGRMTRVDGLVLDVVPLLRWPGNQAEVHIEETLDDLATTTAEAQSIAGVLVAESMSDALSVTGTLDVSWVGECRRCLEPTGGVLPVEVREIYERSAVEGETFELDGDQVDLEPMVREQVLLALPLAPLCDDACVGPAPEQFPATVERDADDGEGDGDGPAGDPRWAALDALTFDDDER